MAKNVVSFKADMTKKGWRLLEDVSFSGENFFPEVVGFVRSNESFLSLNEVRKRAKKIKACLGQHHAEWLLENQHLISWEWRNYHLIFPGTVWQVDEKNYRIPYLRWDGWQWILDFCYGENWDTDDDRLVRPRSL